ncbi:amino acid transporter [Escherichia coli]|nr:amino acid transporter [Escherichia coli]
MPFIGWPDAGRVGKRWNQAERYGLNAVGANGSYLVEMDNKALLTHVDINNVVCADALALYPFVRRPGERIESPV